MLSCTFDRRGCRHDSLFLSEYKRTNRTKGTKILRCFPHCCPEHVNRSYCGSALHVQVRTQASKRPRSEFDGGLLPAPRLHIDNVFVFAHFEEVGLNTFSLDDEVPANVLFDSIQTEQNPKGEWIEGRPHEAVDAASHLYQINPGARWYYEWESAATKAQRFTKHVLKVYVFQGIPGPSGDAARLRVAAITSSTEFMVVSYRRAATELRSDRRILALLAENVVRQSGELGLEPEGIFASLGQKMLPYLIDNHAKEDNPSKASPTSSCSPRVHAVSRDDSIDDRRLWEARNSDVLQMSKRIAVVRHFLSVVPATDFQRPLREWSDALARACCRKFQEPYQTEAMSESLSPPPLVQQVFSLAFLSPLRGSPLPSLTAAQVGLQSANIQLLVSQCVETVSWVLLDKSNRRVMDQLLLQSVEVLLNKPELRDMFLRWTGTLYNHMDRFLVTRFGSSLSKLYENIVAAMFQVEVFAVHRPMLLELLSSTTMDGLEDFVSQVRASFVQSQRGGLKRRRGEESLFRGSPLLRLSLEGSPRSFLSSPFTGNWALDSRQCVISPVGSIGLASRVPPLSVQGAMEWMREFAYISLSVDSSRQHVRIQSCCTVSDALSDGMHLILDGKQRIFDAFPSGRASTIYWNGLSCGDYHGQLLNQECILLEFFAWPGATRRPSDLISQPASALRMKLRVRLVPLYDAYSRVWGMAADAVIEQGLCRVDEGELATKSQQARRHAVTSWATIYEMQATYTPL